MGIVCALQVLGCKFNLSVSAFNRQVWWHTLIIPALRVWIPELTSQPASPVASSRLKRDIPEDKGVTCEKQRSISSLYTCKFVHTCRSIHTYKHKKMKKFLIDKISGR